MPIIRLLALCLVLAASPAPALAMKCSTSPAGFGKWLVEFKETARSQGISTRVLGNLDGLTYATAVI
ncbi:MAG: lytic murein transglycosylase, partial [Aestuariivirga sp.]